jgi:predicted amidohydrolase YtcJ
VTRTLFTGGSVYTPADPFATALLVEDGTVAWVGSDGAAAAWADGADAVVPLSGALVTPAFVDAHVHTTEAGLLLDGVDLTPATSLADALRLVALAARRRPGARLIGHGWDETTWPEGRPPSAAELDRAGDGSEVFLSRVDVHSAVVSTALVERAAAVGVRVSELDGWDGTGRVERDAHHALRDLTRALAPRARADLQRAALQGAAAAGIASVHEMSAPHVAPPEDLRRLLALAADPAEALPEVVGYWGEAVTEADDVAALLARVGGPGGGVRGLAGDLCVDGSVGSRTAAFAEPYADADAAGLPGTRGHLYLDAEQVAAHVVACTLAGVQAGFHAIGDAAVAVLVAGLRAADATLRAGGLAAGAGAVRHRLEHVEDVDDAAVAELARLGVVASVQPAFDAAWGGPGGMYAERLGPQRGVRLNPLARLTAAGVPLALGSDAPVTPFDPWGTVRAATYHRTVEQRISARAAFLAHTRGGRRAAGQEGQGVLRPGSAATFAVWSAGDLVVQAPDDRIQAWSTDPRSGTPGLPDVSPGADLPTCLRTVRDGRTIFDAGALEER